MTVFLLRQPCTRDQATRQAAGTKVSDSASPAVSADHHGEAIGMEIFPPHLTARRSGRYNGSDENSRKSLGFDHFRHWRWAANAKRSSRGQAGSADVGGWALAESVRTQFSTMNTAPSTIKHEVREPPGLIRWAENLICTMPVIVHPALASW